MILKLAQAENLTKTVLFEQLFKIICLKDIFSRIKSNTNRPEF